MKLVPILLSARALVLATGASGSVGSIEISSNWSGYVAESPDPAQPLSFSDVTGTWRVPRVTCTRAGTSAAFWVGIGSSQSPALEQLGSSADCSPKRVATYRLWTEMVPAPAHFLTMKVRPGDTVTAALLPLSNFGTVGFSKIAATASGHTGVLDDPLWRTTPIALASSARVARYSAVSNAAGAVPDPIAADGRSFTVSFRQTFGAKVPAAPLSGAPLPSFVH